MTWNIHKKLLLTGLNTAPALDPCLVEPICDFQWDPAGCMEQDLSPDKTSNKKLLPPAIGAAVLIHLLLFLLWSRVGMTEVPSLSNPPLMTFTFSFQNPEPLAMANSGPPATPSKSIQNHEVKTSLKQPLFAGTPNKDELKPQPEPVGSAEKPSSAPEPSSDSGNALITPIAGAEGEQASDPDGGATSLINPNAALSSAGIYQTAYHNTPGTGQTPMVKAAPDYGINPAPEYPVLAKHRGYEGLVFLEVLVDRKGKVAELRLARSSGYPVLDQAALQAVKKWLFKPAKRGTEPVEDWVKVPIRFQLNEQN
jgi:protein TonB